MRTFLLLALALMTVTAKHSIKKILLSNIIQSVNKTLNDPSEKNLDKFVKDIFHGRSCSETSLCQAAKVLKNTHLTTDPHHMIYRHLFGYANYTRNLNCSISSSEEHPMRNFLKKIKACCQDLNQHRIKKNVKRS